MSPCTLHKLIENIEENTIVDSKQKERPHKRFMGLMDEIQTLAPRAVCFDMGVDSLVDGFKVIPELFKLPYDICWFEGHYDGFDLGEYKFGFFCESDKLGFVSVSIFVWSAGFKVWMYLGHAAVGIFPGSSGTLSACETDIASDPRLDNNFLIKWLAAFLSALNCSNVKRTSTEPDKKLQKARSVRGKKPLFSFWTLKFPLFRGGDGCESHGGGSGTKKRGHLCRGHARQFKKGHWTWVRAHAKGDFSIGVVAKDYQVV